MGVQLGLSCWGRNVNWGYLRIGCWGRYLVLRGMRWQGSGEDYIMRSLLICTPHHIVFGWSNKRPEMGRCVACMADRRGAYRVLVGRPEGKRPHRIDWHRWEYNITMDLQVSDGFIDWIDLAQDSVMNLQVPWDGRAFLDWLRTCYLLKKDCPLELCVCRTCKSVLERLVLFTLWSWQTRWLHYSFHIAVTATDRDLLWRCFGTVALVMDKN